MVRVLADGSLGPSGHSITGNDLLLALIVGLEVTPRIGLALGGVDLLNRGIHSGTLMGE